MFGMAKAQRRPVISIRDDDDPADEISRLEPMLAKLNEVIETLWMEVEALRGELARARGVVETEVPATFDRPPTRVAPARSVDVDSDRRTLRLLIDDLNGSAETLWYESQWVRSQLASVLEDLRGLSDSASAWHRRN